jgi:chorismate-pyruvate lyase
MARRRQRRAVPERHRHGQVVVGELPQRLTFRTDILKRSQVSIDVVAQQVVIAEDRVGDRDRVVNVVERMREVVLSCLEGPLVAAEAQVSARSAEVAGHILRHDRKDLIPGDQDLLEVALHAIFRYPDSAAGLFEPLGVGAGAGWAGGGR